MTPKRPLEINWPLGLSLEKLTRRYQVRIEGKNDDAQQATEVVESLKNVSRLNLEIEISFIDK